MRGLAAAPLESLEVARHRADGVRRAARQVDPAVTIEVHGVLHHARRHELRHAHGAGVAAQRRQGVGAGAVRQRQELLQFAGEERLAGGSPRVGCGEIEGQRGQRVQHAVAAQLLAVQGFHADDADDDLCRHAVLPFGALQRRAVGLPERDAGADADRVDEAAAIQAPVLGGSPRRWQHQARDARQVVRLADGLAHPFAVQVAAFGHVVGPAHHVLAGGVGRPHGRLAHRGGPLRAPRLLFQAIFGPSQRRMDQSSYNNNSKKLGALHGSGQAS